MLIIFDIDGTLCDTNGVDAACYAEAVERVTGRKLSSVNWSTYPEVTNAAIAQDFLREAGERDIAARERQIRDMFVQLLEEAGKRSPELFRPIEGSRELLAGLKKKGRPAAIATGCWQESARVKLRLSGLEADGIPFASSTDTRRRAAIIALAADRAGHPLKDSLYVGDAQWDAKAARELGIPFIGIGRNHELLRLHGADAVFRSFPDADAFYEAVECCGRGPG